MIVTKLSGGLGNQMFQYAAGRNLSLKRGEKLMIDASRFNYEGVTPRKYALSQFNIQGTVIFENQLTPYIVKVDNIFPNISSSIRGAINKFKGNTYLHGTFGGEKYFREFAETIKQDFSLKKKLRYRLAENSISVHIRRGDYITNSKVSHKYQTLGLDYYQKALKIILKKTKNPTLYIFSDDIDWAKKNFKSNLKMVFIEDPKSPQEQLILMSLCKHNVIANSSFSWWPAWLNRHSDKIIIAPSKWLNNSKSSDLILPKSWIRV